MENKKNNEWMQRGTNNQEESQRDIVFDKECNGAKRKMVVDGGKEEES